MSSGYAWKGFFYKVIVSPNVDENLADQMLESIENEVIEKRLISEELRSLRRGGRIVPFFSLGNYSEEEQPAMERLRQLGKEKWGLTKEGGNLRKSVREWSDREGNRVLLIMVVWSTPYLGYLVARGVSRHAGTTTNFYVEIQEKGEVARFIRSKAATYARHAGINPRDISVRVGGIIDR